MTFLNLVIKTVFILVLPLCVCGGDGGVCRVCRG